MTQVYAFPPSELSFSHASGVLRLQASSGQTASINITIAAPIDATNQLDYRMFVESFSGNDIFVMHGANEIGETNSAGDTNGSNTATDGGQIITITSAGPCNHVLSSFTFDVAPE